MYVTCPDPACQVPAEILDRITLGSTNGPIDHVRTYCVRRHVFALPADRVPGIVGSGPARRPFGPPPRPC